MSKRRAGAAQYRLQILQDAMRLRLNIFADYLSTRGVKGDLAGGMNELADANGLTVWANRCRSMGCVNLCALHSWFSFVRIALSCSSVVPVAFLVPSESD